MGNNTLYPNGSNDCSASMNSVDRKNTPPSFRHDVSISGSISFEIDSNGSYNNLNDYFQPKNMFEDLKSMIKQKPSVEFKSKKNSTKESFNGKYGDVSSIRQLNESKLMMIGHKNNYRLNLNTKHIAERTTNTCNVQNYIYYEKKDIHLYVAKYHDDGSVKFRVIKKDEQIFGSKEVIKHSIDCNSQDVTGSKFNYIYNRSVCLLDSRVYGLSSASMILMFDIDDLINDEDYEAVVINADTPLSDIVLDCNTLVCLNQKGSLSRIDGHQQAHNISDWVELSGYSDSERDYFTLAVKDSVIVVVSGKEKQNTVELLDHDSLKVKDCLDLKNLDDGGAVLMMKIFKKKYRSFIVGTESFHMYLLGVYNDQLGLIEKKKYYLSDAIYFFEELLRSKNKERLIELIVCGSWELHHIVTIKINN